jgi:hypothetical protein
VSVSCIIITKIYIRSGERAEQAAPLTQWKNDLGREIVRSTRDAVAGTSIILWDKTWPVYAENVRQCRKMAPELRDMNDQHELTKNTTKGVSEGSITRKSPEVERSNVHDDENEGSGRARPAAAVDSPGRVSDRDALLSSNEEDDADSWRWRCGDDVHMGFDGLNELAQTLVNLACNRYFAGRRTVTTTSPTSPLSQGSSPSDHAFPLCCYR